MEIPRQLMDAIITFAEVIVENSKEQGGHEFTSTREMADGRPATDPRQLMDAIITSADAINKQLKEKSISALS
jgi:hypothetical protein